VQERRADILLDGAQQRGLRDSRDADREPCGDEVDARVEVQFTGSGADVDGQPAAAEQTRDIGGEVWIASSRVVYDDVRLIADDRRVLRRGSAAMSGLTSLR
jgi:hypothetical protein